MAVAPAFTIPVPGPDKSTAAVATTKSTKAPATAKAPTTAKLSKAALTKAAVKTAEGKVKTDLTNEKTLRKELGALDSKLAGDMRSAVKLEKQARTQKNGITKAKLTGSAGKHLTKLTTKGSTVHNHLSLTRNKHHLRISTAGSRGTRHSVTPLGSAISPLWSGRSGRSAVGTGQSPYFGGYSPSFQSPGFSPPYSGSMRETISYQPSSGGGYTENINFSPQAQQISRRAITPTTPTTPSTPLDSPSVHVPAHRSRKSSTLHKHTFADAMQLTTMLLEAEKLVNGLEEQMNKPQTVFTNLKRASKFKRPTTPITPATPVTPSPVKTT